MTPAALDAKRDAARDRIAVDVAFWGGLVPDHLDQIEALAEAGVRGFKAFLVDSGVPEFPPLASEAIESVAPRLVATGLPLLVHAEDAATIAAHHPDGSASSRSYERYLATRPAAAEVRAVEALLGVVERTGLRLHVVHLATAEALPALDAARAAGLPVTVETCPHYLTFAAEEIADGATAMKCAPPIRGAADREALWRALAAGRIDLVASDHSPCPPSAKCLDSGDLLVAWGGIASLEVSLAATWTGAAARGLDPTLLARRMAAEPARLAGLDGVKGRLDVGYDADLVVWDPEEEMTVEAERLSQRHPISAYDGMRLRGVVHRTFVRGLEVFRRGTPPTGWPSTGFHGRLLDP